MRKKIIIISIILITTILVILYLTRKNNVPSVVAPPLPSDIPKYVDYKGPINIDYPKENFKFPEKLPLIKVSPPKSVSETEAVDYAKNLGFSNNFVTFNDSEFGTTFIWNEDGNYLIIYSRSGKIVYNPKISSQSTSLRVTPEQIKQTAKDFLVQNKLVDESLLGISILYGLSSSDEHSNIVSFENANIYKVVFSPNISGFEIVGINPFDSVIGVWLNKNGQIIKTEISKLDGISESNEIYNLKSYEDFTDSINQASIINIDDGNIPAQDVEPTEILGVRVENVRLAYLVNSYKEELLKPVFILEGKITLKSSEHNAVLYMNAFK